MVQKERADKLVVSRGLAESTQKAQALIMAGLVFSEGKRIEKPGQRMGTDQEISLKEKIPYVSRGGLKLDEALRSFKISVQDKIAADLGASTGGFTDCLLQKGAKKVFAVDVDVKQLDWRLREDPRVVCIEKNARYLKRDDFADSLDIVTMDLSFISVLKVLPAIREFIGSGALLSLIKPQFEVEKGQVGKKGVVRDKVLHEDVLKKITREAMQMGFFPGALIKSSFRGQRGNHEFFIIWTLGKESLDSEEIQRVIKEAVWNEKN
jgi:23S rRNA (cytidine1920-2'-O)/16S rRNA (cytidine1409-2'-O)-methyltransferase